MALPVAASTRRADRLVLLGNAAGPPMLFYSPDGRSSSRLEDLAHGRAAFVLCRDSRTLHLAAEDAVDGAAIVTIAADIDSIAVCALQSIRHRFRALPILLVNPANPGRDQAAFDLSAAAAAIRPDFSAPDRVDDLERAVHVLLQCANQQSPAGLILAMVDREYPDIPTRLRNFVAVAARAPRSLHTIAAIAAVTGHSVRSLERCWRLKGLPSAREIAGWILVVRATSMLQDPECRLKRVVRSLPFSDEAAVGARFRRYAGRSPTDMRDHDALTRLVERHALAFRGAALASHGTGRGNAMGEGH